MLDQAAANQRHHRQRTAKRPVRRGGEIIAHQPRQEARQIGEAVAHLRRLVQGVAEDLCEIPGKHVGKHRRALDHSRIAEAGFLPGQFVPVDQDDIAPPLLQVQGSADADHARTQHENIGLEFRHHGTPKVECYVLVPAAYSEASY